MDGNRRWAKKNNVSELEGHKAGMDALVKIVEEAGKSGVNYLTVYALSSENYKSRSPEEIDGLLSLLTEGAKVHLSRLKSQGVKLRVIGAIESLPGPTRIVIKKLEKDLKDGRGPMLNVALNYGSRNEIVSAAKKLSMTRSDFTEDNFEMGLYTAAIPDPDLLIRTGGEKRLSNFLLWQVSYTELYFTDILWPDFDDTELNKAIEDFKQRKRNFGV